MSRSVRIFADRISAVEVHRSVSAPLSLLTYLQAGNTVLYHQHSELRSMPTRKLFVALTAVCLATRVVSAQQTPADQPDADAAIRSKLKSDLRNLVVAQESYFAGHSAYADLIGNLSYRPSDGSQVSLVATQNNAWAAVASNPSWPGKSCVIFINLADKYRPKTAQEKRVGETSDEGKPMCDGDPKPEK